ncbi:MAG: LexA family protein [Leucobacter sp.]
MWVQEIRKHTDDAEMAIVEINGVEIACGFPSPSQDYETKEIDLNEKLMPNQVSSFLVRVRGHSMTGAGIFDGDELVVDRSIRAEDGHVVIAVVDGELTVKRLRVLRDRVVLAAENPNFPDIEVAELSDLRIWGVVTRSLHHVLRT